MKSFNILDDDHVGLYVIFKSRLPWLVLGLLGGIVASFVVANFEEVLNKNLQLAFFVPLIVYMSSAVGSQTETVYVRNLSKFKLSFWTYMLKESLVGLFLGILFGIAIGIFTNFWLHSSDTALAVGLAMFVNITIAPSVALIVPEILLKEHKDPAVGAGPFMTVIQDIISLLIYFTIATVIIF